MAPRWRPFASVTLYSYLRVKELYIEVELCINYKLESILVSDRGEWQVLEPFWRFALLELLFTSALQTGCLSM